MTSQRLSLRADEGLLEAIYALAGHCGIKPSAVVRILCREGLKALEKPRGGRTR